MLPSFQPLIFAALFASFVPRHAQRWGEEGHRISALIAARYLDPTERTQLCSWPKAACAIDLDLGGLFVWI